MTIEAVGWVVEERVMDHCLSFGWMVKREWVRWMERWVRDPWYERMRE